MKTFEKNGLVQYQILSGQSDMRNNPYDNNVFYPFDGEPVDVEFSEFGEGIRDRLQQRGAIRDEKKKARIDLIKARGDKKSAKAESKILRGKAKLSESEAQKQQAVALGSSESDVALANALAKTAPKSGKTVKKDNTMLIVGISAGVLILAGVGLYMYNKKKGK